MLGRSFLLCERGSVATIFALMAVTLLVAIGCAVDYVRAVHLQSALQSAADAASLAGASNSIVRGGSDKTGNSDEQRIKVAKKIFSENIKASVGLDITPVVTIESGVVKVFHERSLPTVFMRLIAINDMDVAANSNAVSGSRDPRDIYLVLDMSASLGLAADADNRRRLMELSRNWIRSSNTTFRDTHPNGCMFACHDRSGFEPNRQNSYDLARQAGIRLREDVLLEASATFLNSVLDPSLQAVKDGDLRVGVFGFSNSARWLSKPTSDRGAAKKSVSSFPNASRQDTLVDVALPWIDSQAQAESGSRRRTYVIVTDGVAGGKSRDFVWSEFSSKLCQNLKDNGADVFVLEVLYEDLSGDSFYDFYVSRFDHKITPALETCASPGQFLSASTPEQISGAFDDISQSINQTFTRLVN